MTWNRTSFPVLKGFIADSVTVATRAQRKLLHIVLILNDGLISSIENMTPPIGEPNATATPAALAAVKISLILPPQVSPMGHLETVRLSSL